MSSLVKAALLGAVSACKVDSEPHSVLYLDEYEESMLVESLLAPKIPQGVVAVPESQTEVSPADFLDALTIEAESTSASSVDFSLNDWLQLLNSTHTQTQPLQAAALVPLESADMPKPISGSPADDPGGPGDPESPREPPANPSDRRKRLKRSSPLLLESQQDWERRRRFEDGVRPRFIPRIFLRTEEPRPAPLLLESLGQWERRHAHSPAVAEAPAVAEIVAEAEAPAEAGATVKNQKITKVKPPRKRTAKRKAERQANAGPLIEVPWIDPASESIPTSQPLPQVPAGVFAASSTIIGANESVTIKASTIPVKISHVETEVVAEAAVNQCDEAFTVPATVDFADSDEAEPPVDEIDTNSVDPMQPIPVSQSSVTLPIIVASTVGSLLVLAAVAFFVQVSVATSGAFVPTVSQVSLDFLV